LSRCQPCQPAAAQGPLPTVEPPVATAAPVRPPSRVVSAEVLDPRAFERLRTTLGQQAGRLLPGLIQGFYEDTERLLAQAQQALAQEQTEDLRRAAHSLKSTSATFGAMALAAAARELEYLARDGLLDEAAGCIARVETEFARARAALEAMRL
jgi:two-component system sensor histidine kinase/response regulator